MNGRADWEEIERLFAATVDLPILERPALLALASESVRAEVESLLAADVGASFATPPVHLVADLLEDQPGALAEGAIVGRYSVESLVAVGGMGEVYRAHDPGGAPVALKILRRHLVSSLQAKGRFETEARAASALTHANVVTLREFGESPAGLFIATEWVDGPTFREVIDAGVIGSVQALAWGRQAACGLSAAHAAGVLHRDIKPENIMLDSDGVLKILDFGLARLEGPVKLDLEAVGATGTISGTLSGTLLYMPPEILSGELATSASDVYSLGTFLFELWTGRHPFAADSPLEVFKAIECREVAALSTTCGEVPGEIDDLILRMLNREPLRRPSASEAFEVFSRSSART